MNTKYNPDGLNDHLTSIETPEFLEEVRAVMLGSAYLVRIEKAMHDKNMSKRDLAKKLNISASFISQVFNFDKLMNFKLLARIEKTLDLDFLQMWVPFDDDDSIPQMHPTLASSQIVPRAIMVEANPVQSSISFKYHFVSSPERASDDVFGLAA